LAVIFTLYCPALLHCYQNIRLGDREAGVSEQLALAILSSAVGESRTRNLSDYQSVSTLNHWAAVQVVIIIVISIMMSFLWYSYNVVVIVGI